VSILSARARLWIAMATLSCLPGMSRAADLGAAAQKETERRDKNRDAGVKARVITSQDVRTGPRGATPAPSPRPAVGVAQDAAAEPAIDVTEERKARGAVLKPQLQAAELALAAAQAARARVLVRIDEFNRISVGAHTSAGRAALRKDLEVAQETVRLAKDHRDSIEDTARREHIPPGYLR
jgi:hypothetical protein